MTCTVRITNNPLRCFYLYVDRADAARDPSLEDDLLLIRDKLPLPLSQRKRIHPKQKDE
jgi:hypothetical protein